MAEHDPQMLKGVLGLLLLRLVSAQEDYGYSIVVRLHEHGFSELAEGTVYPALSRLETQGLLEAHLVRSTSGPARKYYRPTAAGHVQMKRAGQLWHRLVATVAPIVPLEGQPLESPPSENPLPESPLSERTPR